MEEEWHSKNLKPLTVCLAILAHVAIPWLRIPANLRSAGVRNRPSLCIDYWITLRGLGTSNIVGRPPKRIRQVAIPSPRQSYLTVDKSANNPVEYEKGEAFMLSKTRPFTL